MHCCTYVQALRARCAGDLIQEAWHLLNADLWNKCHVIVVNHIAPQAIVNGNRLYLITYLILIIG